MLNTKTSLIWTKTAIFWPKGTKKASGKGQLPLQEQEVGQHSAPYLLVSKTQTSSASQILQDYIHLLFLKHLLHKLLLSRCIRHLLSFFGGLIYILQDIHFFLDNLHNQHLFSPKGSIYFISYMAGSCVGDRCWVPTFPFHLSLKYCGLAGILACSWDPDWLDVKWLGLPWFLPSFSSSRVGVGVVGRKWVFDVNILIIMSTRWWSHCSQRLSWWST